MKQAREGRGDEAVKRVRNPGGGERSGSVGPGPRIPGTGSAEGERGSKVDLRARARRVETFTRPTGFERALGRPLLPRPRSEAEAQERRAWPVTRPGEGRIGKTPQPLERQRGSAEKSL